MTTSKSIYHWSRYQLTDCIYIHVLVRIVLAKFTQQPAALSSGGGGEVETEPELSADNEDVSTRRNTTAVYKFDPRATTITSSILRNRMYACTYVRMYCRYYSWQPATETFNYLR